MMYLRNDEDNQDENKDEDTSSEQPNYDVG